MKSNDSKEDVIPHGIDRVHWHSGLASSIENTGSPRSLGESRPWSDRETAANFVATFIDIASILFAYRLGVEQFGAVASLAYACFDAYIVVWQRKRFANWIRRVFHLIA